MTLVIILPGSFFCFTPAKSEIGMPTSHYRLTQLPKAQAVVEIYLSLYLIFLLTKVIKVTSNVLLYGILFYCWWYIHDCSKLHFFTRTISAWELQLIICIKIRPFPIYLLFCHFNFPIFRLQITRIPRGIIHAASIFRDKT